MYNYNNELYHFGVKGMKWGVRRASSNPAVSASRARMKSAKANYKAARKAANKSFNSAYNYTNKHSIGVLVKKSKHHSEANKTEANKRWADSYDKMNKENAAKSKYKQAKKDYKAEKKAARNTPEAKVKKAAKIGAAVAATGLAAYGAYKVGKKVNANVKNKHVELATQRADKAFSKSVDRGMRRENVQFNKRASARVNAERYKYNPKMTNHQYRENIRNYHRNPDATLQRNSSKILKTAMDRRENSINQARNDNFATAAKDVYQNYKKNKKKR